MQMGLCTTAVAAAGVTAAPIVARISNAAKTAVRIRRMGVMLLGCRRVVGAPDGGQVRRARARGPGEERVAWGAVGCVAPVVCAAPFWPVRVALRRTGPWSPGNPLPGSPHSVHAAMRGKTGKQCGQMEDGLLAW